MTPSGYIWHLDRELLLWINGSWGSGWDTFWWLVSQPWAWVPLFACVIGLLWHKFGWRQTLVIVALAAICVALADQGANFFKTHTPKFRPSRTLMLWEGVPYNQWVHIVKNAFTGRSYIGGQFGTVSGHAATSMALGLFLGLVYRRWWLSLVLGLYVVLTCFSRMYLGVHFPLDILFGLTLGTIIALAMLWLWKSISKKYNEKLHKRN